MAVRVHDLVLGHDSAAGSTSPLEGKLGELIAYDDALSIEDREHLEDYLAAKWLGAAPTHDESSFGNLEVWLDSSDVANLMLNGSNVEGWLNLAGEQSFYSPVPDANPSHVPAGLNGHDVIRFDGEDDTLRNAFAQPWLDGPEYTVVGIAVPRPPTNDQASYIVSANDEVLTIPGMGLAVANLGVDVSFRHKAPANVPGSGDRVTATGGTAEAPILAIATWNDGSMRLEAGFATQTGTPTQVEHGPNLFFYVGSHNSGSSVDNFAGDIAEVLIFRHELSFTERTALRAMLEEKWGL